MRVCPKVAFTLLELLVVIAIIGLLTAILLPALRTAKQQAKIATCLANLRGIGGAAGAYITEHDDLVYIWPLRYTVAGEAFPRQFNWVLRAPWIWGGGVPDKRARDWDPSQGFWNPAVGQGADTYNFTASERPLNHYLTPGVSWDDPRRVGRGNSNPLRHQLPYELPDTFKCPADSTGSFGSEREVDYRSWEWWGHSYPLNWSWGYEYLPRGSYDIQTPVGGRADMGQRSKVREVLRRELNRGAAEFIFFHESQTMVAFVQAWPRGYEADSWGQYDAPGWHKKDNSHSVSFLDGHAEFRQLDTRYVDGPGWTIWAHRPWSPYWQEFEDD